VDKKVTLATGGWGVGRGEKKFQESMRTRRKTGEGQREELKGTKLRGGE